jgi:hypothetical protein
MTDESETNSSPSVFNLQVQTNKEDDKDNEGTINNPSFLFKPAVHAMDEWLSTSKKNAPISNKYSITSTGNENVEISRE